MGQRGEGTTRATLEKADLRGGLTVKQTSHFYLSLGNILIPGVLLSLTTERRSNLGKSALELNLCECERCLMPLSDHKSVQ